MLIVYIWGKVFMRTDGQTDFRSQPEDVEYLHKDPERMHNDSVIIKSPCRDPFSLPKRQNRKNKKPLGKNNKFGIIHIEVSGLIEDENSKQAVLYRADTVLRVIEKNDTICSFKVKAITDTGLILSHQNGDTILNLKDGFR
jgi:hypothetical protein